MAAHVQHTILPYTLTLAQNEYRWHNSEAEVPFFRPLSIVERRLALRIGQYGSRLYSYWSNAEGTLDKIRITPQQGKWKSRRIRESKIHVISPSFFFIISYNIHRIYLGTPSLERLREHVATYIIFPDRGKKEIHARKAWQSRLLRLYSFIGLRHSTKYVAIVTCRVELSVRQRSNSDNASLRLPRQVIILQGDVA